MSANNNEDAGWHPDDLTKIYRSQRLSPTNPVPPVDHETTSDDTLTGTVGASVVGITSRVIDKILQAMMAPYHSQDRQRPLIEALILLMPPLQRSQSGGSQSGPVSSGATALGPLGGISRATWLNTEPQPAGHC